MDVSAKQQLSLNGDKITLCFIQQISLMNPVLFAEKMKKGEIE